MPEFKKNTGKGHTLFEHDPPTETTDIWILIAESCYEISRTLLKQNAYASELSVSFSGFDYSSGRGGYTIIPQSFLRYPIELYSCIEFQKDVQNLISDLLFSIRRVQVSAECRPYISPLFDDSHDFSGQYQMLENIRNKEGQTDIIGVGLEGFRKRRISTYTAKRADEVNRAKKLLLSNSMCKMIMAL